MNVLKILIFSLVALCSVLCVAQGSEKSIVCYMNNWSPYRQGSGKFEPEDVDPNLCTHLIYAFAIIDESGRIQSSDTWMDFSQNNIKRTTNLKKKNPNLKNLIAVGGWSAGSMMFSKMAGDPIKTQNFIKSSMEFIKRHNFDGLDIDWEYPSQRGGKKEDNENFVKLLASLRRECDIEGKLLTVAVGASTTMIGDSYDVRGISNYVDLICLMTYDYNAYWSYRVDHNAPLAGHSPQNVKRTVESWIERGAEPHKIILGIATYGQTFKINANSGCKVGTPAIGPGTQGPFTKQAGMKAYYEFCNMDDEWLYTYDSIARVPMLESPTECISYDNEDSIREKGKFANEMGLGGLMTWEVDFDDFRGECGKKFPLLKAMNDVMGYSQVEENPSKPVTSKPNTSKPSPPQDKDKCSHNELYPHESDCGLFYQCNHNKRIVMNCPTGLQYDKDLQGCNYPEFVNCITQN